MVINGSKKEIVMSSFFPHKVIRDGQKEFIDDLKLVFSNRQVLIADAPTGLGKTAGALSAALEVALEKKKKVFFLTNRHTQHALAVETLKQIKEKTGKNVFCADLIGKRWMCSQEIAGVFGSDFNEFCRAIVEKGECEFYQNIRSKNSLTVEGKSFLKEIEQRGPLNTSEIMAASKDKAMCSYEVALGLARTAPVLIGDYYYLFNPIVAATILAKLELAIEDIILIVDEGHNLPARIMEMMSTSLTTNMLMNSIIEAKKYNYGGLIAWLQELNTILTTLGSFDNTEKEILIAKEQFISKINVVVKYDELLSQLELAAEEVREKQRRSYLGGIAAFLQAWKGDEQGYVRILSEQRSKQGSYLSLNHSCLDASLITKDLFSRIHAGVIMSGTLSPTGMYKDLLGIERNVQKNYRSPFPLENRLQLIVPETSTTYRLRGEQMFKLMARKCVEISALIPGNIALFFPSYDLRNKVGSFISTDKKLFWEKADLSKEEKELLLAQFKAEKDRGGILLGVTGANFAEGVDFPGDLLNGVVVAGLPLARPDLKTKEIVRYYDQKFSRGWEYGYVYPAVNKCRQSAGRCIRSETDRGAIIFLDERFAWKNYYDCFPREGLIVTKEYGKLLQEFFKK